MHTLAPVFAQFMALIIVATSIVDTLLVRANSAVKECALPFSSTRSLSGNVLELAQLNTSVVRDVPCTSSGSSWVIEPFEVEHRNARAVAHEVSSFPRIVMWWILIKLFSVNFPSRVHTIHARMRCQQAIYSRPLCTPLHIRIKSFSISLSVCMNSLWPALNPTNIRVYTTRRRTRVRK